MREPKLVDYLAVAFLGLAAVVLAFVAGATKFKASDISMTAFGKCEYPRTPAIILGYIAASLTLISQIITSVVFRSAYRGRNISDTQATTAAIICFILSWVMSGIGIGLLVSGAYLTSRQEFLAATRRCYTLKPNLFKVGGWMVLIACSDGLCSFYCFSTDRRSTPEAVPYQGGIAMANYQHDAASTNPNQKH